MTLEFQVVLLAGGAGSRMYPLTEDIPKALLPVAGKPMIEYNLNMLERGGFTEAIVVVRHSDHVKISHYFNDVFDGKLKADIVVVDDDSGTADALRACRDKIRVDFMVISSDLVTDIPLHRLANVFRIHGSAVAALLSTQPKLVSAGRPLVKKEGEGGNNADLSVKDFIGVDTNTSRILYMRAQADLEDELTLARSLLSQFPRFRIHADLVDAHFYIMSRWVLDFLRDKKRFSSIKGELLPYLVEKQSSVMLKETVGGVRRSVFSYIPPNSNGMAIEMSNAPMVSPRPIVKTSANEISANVDKMATVATTMAGMTSDPVDGCVDTSNDSEENTVIDQRPDLTCHMYLCDGGICMRGNTLHSFLQLNEAALRDAGKLLLGDGETLIHASVVKGDGCSFGKTVAMIGTGCTFGDSCSVKRSTVGKHCTAGSNVKLNTSVIMDHVTIEDNCTITNSIICHNAYIKKGCILKDCQVGKGFTVEADTTATNESLVAGQGFL